MKLNRRRLRRLIKEEYSKVLKVMYMSGGHMGGGMRGDSAGMSGGNVAACVQECMLAIPPMMKQICGMGMSHMVINDIYHICAPIAEKHGCDADSIHEMVMQQLGA